MPLREAPKHFGMVVFQRMREAALELGRRLAARGVLSDADEVFFMAWEELASLVPRRAGPARPARPPRPEEGRVRRLPGPPRP